MFSTKWQFDSMLVIEPLGGLSNRMRAIDSAIALGREINKPVKVIWYRNWLLNCSFNELFEPLPSVSEYVERNGNFYPLKYIRKITRLGYALHYDKYLNRKAMREMIASGFDFRELAQYRSIRISSCHRFYSSGDDYSEFRPRPEVLEKVESVTSKFNQNTVGVHIRRADNVASIQKSPTSKFIAFMEQEISNNPDTHFFLATDSHGEEETMMARFPDKVVTCPKGSLARTNNQAIIDALVDLLCLSRTRKLLGSHSSSFTETACELGGIECVVVG